MKTFLLFMIPEAMILDLFLETVHMSPKYIEDKDQACMSRLNLTANLWLFHY